METSVKDTGTMVAHIKQVFPKAEVVFRVDPPPLAVNRSTKDDKIPSTWTLLRGIEEAGVDAAIVAGAWVMDLRSVFATLDPSVYVWDDIHLNPTFSAVVFDMIIDGFSFFKKTAPH